MTDNPSGATVTLPTDREIMITRTFDAPRALVYEMWTKPEHVTRWWDPSGTPLAQCDIDLRPGGSFRFLHRGTGSNQHVFGGRYVDIEPPSRLVFTTPTPSGGVSTGTLDFKTVGKTTRLTMTIACASRADRDALLAMRVDAGTVRSLENLASRLATVQDGRDA
jgi:uncharacterized protein YndB with AHSA1/START domain